MCGLYEGRQPGCAAPVPRFPLRPVLCVVRSASGSQAVLLQQMTETETQPHRGGSRVFTKHVAQIHFSVVQTSSMKEPRVWEGAVQQAGSGAAAFRELAARAKQMSQ